ncbi:hypothetical protein RDI58_031781 [Solanum bulbocastanum]
MPGVGAGAGRASTKLFTYGA